MILSKHIMQKRNIYNYHKLKQIENRSYSDFDMKKKTEVYPSIYLFVFFLRPKSVCSSLFPCFNIVKYLVLVNIEHEVNLELKRNQIRKIFMHFSSFV